MVLANYLKAPQNTIFRQRLHKIFKNNQHTFDKSYKKAKRNFERDKRIHIEQLNTNNPREFWSELNNLGPRKKTCIPMEVYDDNGIVLSDHRSVLNR